MYFVPLFKYFFFFCEGRSQLTQFLRQDFTLLTYDYYSIPQIQIPLMRKVTDLSVCTGPVYLHHRCFLLPFLSLAQLYIFGNFCYVQVQYENKRPLSSLCLVSVFGFVCQAAGTGFLADLILFLMMANLFYLCKSCSGMQIIHPLRAIIKLLFVNVSVLGSSEFSTYEVACLVLSPFV